METANAKPTEDQRGLTAGGSFCTGETKPYDSVGRRRLGAGETWLEVIFLLFVSKFDSGKCFLLQFKSSHLSRFKDKWYRY